MKIINTADNQITFQVEVEETLANAIRRYFHHVPVIAIDEVEISKNDSPLYDETLAHRIGLVPFKMNKSSKNVNKLKLKVKKEGMVLSSEFEGDLKPVYGEIPLTHLDKGQEVDIVSQTKVGTGEEHAKFLPGLMFYRNLVKVILDKSLESEIKDVCKNNPIKEKAGKIVVEDNQKKGVSDFCEGICEKAGKSVEIVPSNELVISIESFGQLDVKDIFEKSVEILKKDLQEVVKAVK